jgi:hypothetical protein
MSIDAIALADAMTILRTAARACVDDESVWAMCYHAEARLAGELATARRYQVRRVYGTFIYDVIDTHDHDTLITCWTGDTAAVDANRDATRRNRETETGGTQ